MHNQVADNRSIRLEGDIGDGGESFLSGVYSLCCFSRSDFIGDILIEKWSMMSSWMLFLSFANIAMRRARYWWSW